MADEKKSEGSIGSSSITLKASSKKIEIRHLTAPLKAGLSYPILPAGVFNEHRPRYYSAGRKIRADQSRYLDRSTVRPYLQHGLPQLYDMGLPRPARKPCRPDRFHPGIDLGRNFKSSRPEKNGVRIGRLLPDSRSFRSYP